MIGLGALGGAPDGAVCSRAGCGDAATWRIDWSNPKIHTDGRTKTWLACDAHVEYLRGFLEARSFPVAVARFADASADPSASGGLDASADPAASGAASPAEPKAVHAAHRAGS